MKLYLLTRLDEIDYDEYTGFVIAAETSDEAKGLAIEAEDNDEGEEHEWECVCISKTVEPDIKLGIILESFSAG